MKKIFSILPSSHCWIDNVDISVLKRYRVYIVINVTIALMSTSSIWASTYIWLLHFCNDMNTYDEFLYITTQFQNTWFIFGIFGISHLSWISSATLILGTFQYNDDSKLPHSYLRWLSSSNNIITLKYMVKLTILSYVKEGNCSKLWYTLNRGWLWRHID